MPAPIWMFFLRDSTSMLPCPPFSKESSGLLQAQLMHVALAKKSSVVLLRGDKLCRYWQEKGFAAIVASRILNLGALAFTIVMATFLLLIFDRDGLKQPCLHEDTCDMATVAVKHPLADESPLPLLFKLAFLGMFSLYWVYSAVNGAVEVWCASTA